MGLAAKDRCRAASPTGRISCFRPQAERRRPCLRRSQPLERIALFPGAAFGHGRERLGAIAEIEPDPKLIGVVQPGIDRRKHTDHRDVLSPMPGEMRAVIVADAACKALAFAGSLSHEDTDELARLRGRERRNERSGPGRPPQPGLAFSGKVLGAPEGRERDSDRSAFRNISFPKSEWRAK